MAEDVGSEVSTGLEASVEEVEASELHFKCSAGRA